MGFLPPTSMAGVTKITLSAVVTSETFKALHKNIDLSIHSLLFATLCVRPKKLTNN